MIIAIIIMIMIIMIRIITIIIAYTHDVCTKSTHVEEGTALLSHPPLD